MVKLEGKKGRKRPRERWVCSLEKVVGGWIEGVEGDGEEEEEEAEKSSGPIFTSSGGRGGKN